jgi:hypothetical protein
MRTNSSLGRYPLLSEVGVVHRVMTIHAELAKLVEKGLDFLANLSLAGANQVGHGCVAGVAPVLPCILSTPPDAQAAACARVWRAGTSVGGGWACTWRLDDPCRGGGRGGGRARLLVEPGKGGDESGLVGRH